MKHSLKIGIALCAVIGLLFVACGGGGGDSSSPSGGSTSGATTIPAAPTNVKAQAVSETEVTISWSAVSGATSYWVHVNAGEQVWNASSSTSFTVDDLEPNKTYKFTVTAHNRAGQSPQSSPVSVTLGSANGDDQGDGNGDDDGGNGGVTDPSGDDGNNQGGTDPGNNGGGRKTYPYRITSEEVTYSTGSLYYLYYSYNSDGSPRQQDHFDKNGNHITTSIVTNNAAGLPVRTETTYLQQDDFREITETEYSNNIPQRSRSYPLGSYVENGVSYERKESTVEYIFSSDGKIAQQKIFEDGTLVATYTFEYDASGRRTNTQVTGHRAGTSGTYTRTYNPDGTVAFVSGYDSLGHETVRHTFTWEAKPTTVDPDLSTL